MGDLQKRKKTGEIDLISSRTKKEVCPGKKEFHKGSLSFFCPRYFLSICSSPGSKPEYMNFNKGDARRDE
ncbi:hypothetical protein RUM43_009381, partial [Polyplax serrata]